MELIKKALQMGKSLLIFLLLAFFVSTLSNAQNADGRIIPESADQLQNPYIGDKKKMMQGARIYQKVCWVCHGDAGKGDGPQSLELRNKPADFNTQLVLGRSDGALFWWISNGGNDMQPFRELLSEEDRWKVVNYVRQLQNKWQ